MLDGNSATHSQVDARKIADRVRKDIDSVVAAVDIQFHGDVLRAMDIVVEMGVRLLTQSP